MLRVAWNKRYNHPVPQGHRFPMLKYDLIPEQLLYEGTIEAENLFEPDLLSEDILLLTHTSGYWDKLMRKSLAKAEQRRIGFELTEDLVLRELMIMQGTLAATEYARQYGIAMNIAGGTHHAYADRGEGFCLLNDLAIAANALLVKGLASKVLIVDLDVHQGNGTASIFQNEERVFTFSMHGAGNIYSSREHSDLDIDLADGTGDTEYLKILEKQLSEIIQTYSPDFMFFQAGVDVLATDKLGKISLTREGCKQRDRIVLEISRLNKIPLVIAMGGGYSDSIKEIVEAHCNTFRLAQHIFF